MSREDLLVGTVGGGVVGTAGAAIIAVVWDAYRVGLPRTISDGGDFILLMLALSSVVAGVVTGAIVSVCKSTFFSSGEQPRRDDNSTRIEKDDHMAPSLAS
jgi:hypothetical protein